MPLSNLEAIIIKVRRLTRSPSSVQITDADIMEYVNTFILYDMPETLRLKTLKTKFSFFTEPYIDSYPNAYKNLFLTTHIPAFVSGIPLQYVPDSNYFYQLYPPRLYNTVITTGTGAVFNYTGTLSAIPVLRNEVLFTSIDANNAGLKLYDNGSGVFLGDGFGTINYITGVYDITFTGAPASGVNVCAQTYSYTPARPESILYYDNTFILRPVPDQVYRIDLTAYKRPEELLTNAQEPELQHWWQYVAYGAAKKVFEDRMDTESVQQIMQEFMQQQIFVERRSIVQNTKKRERTMFNSGNIHRRTW